VLRKLLCKRATFLGAQNQHVKCLFQYTDSKTGETRTIDGIGWNFAQSLPEIMHHANENIPELHLDVVVALESNTWKNKTKMQLRIHSIANSS